MGWNCDTFRLNERGSIVFCFVLFYFFLSSVLCSFACVILVPSSPGSCFSKPGHWCSAHCKALCHVLFSYGNLCVSDVNVSKIRQFLAMFTLTFVSQTWVVYANELVFDSESQCKILMIMIKFSQFTGVI